MEAAGGVKDTLLAVMLAVWRGLSGRWETQVWRDRLAVGKRPQRPSVVTTEGAIYSGLCYSKEGGRVGGWVGKAFLPSTGNQGAAHLLVAVGKHVLCTLPVPGFSSRHL